MHFFKSNLLTSFLLLTIVSIRAQDIHFSQFYASPLNLNPALSGFSDGSYRVAGIYRNQWRSVTTPYQTVSASYDMRLLEDVLKEDIFGVGANIIYDQAGDGNLSLLSITLSTSYHKLLGGNSKHYLGIGIQFGFVQRSLNPNDLTFPSQYDNVSGDFTRNNMEQNLTDHASYFDMQTGIMWSSNVHKRLGIFNGGSIYHLTQPKESFLGDDIKLKSRFTVHGGLRIIASKKIHITPNYIFMYQNKAKETNLGTAVEYHFNDENKTIVSLGGWYRLDDAGMVSASLEYRGIRVGVSYDINTSPLKVASAHRGAFELSLIYIGKINKIQTPVLVPCPRL